MVPMYFFFVSLYYIQTNVRAREWRLKVFIVYRAFILLLLYYAGGVSERRGQRRRRKEIDGKGDLIVREISPSRYIYIEREREPIAQHWRRGENIFYKAPTQKRPSHPARRLRRDGRSSAPSRVFRAADEIISSVLYKWKNNLNIHTHPHTISVSVCVCVWDKKKRFYRVKSRLRCPKS